MLELKNNKHKTYYHCTYLYIVNAVIFKLLLTSYLQHDLANNKNNNNNNITTVVVQYFGSIPSSYSDEVKNKIKNNTILELKMTAPEG